MLLPERQLEEEAQLLPETEGKPVALLYGRETGADLGNAKQQEHYC